MTSSPPNPDSGLDRTLFCAGACDLNHAAVPHPPWDCNAPDNAHTLTATQRAATPDGELPWVRYATPLVLSAGELDRLRARSAAPCTPWRSTSSTRASPRPTGSARGWTRSTIG